MVHKRLLAVEQRATRVITVGEFIDFVMRPIFKAVDATVNGKDATRFKDAAIDCVSRELAIDAGELREVLL